MDRIEQLQCELSESVKEASVRSEEAAHLRREIESLRELVTWLTLQLMKAEKELNRH